MRISRIKKITMRGIAWVLAATVLFAVIGEYIPEWTITAQAAEEGTEDRCVLSLGGGRSAVIKKDGSLWMWGDNTYGDLGDGSTNNSYVPIKIMEDVKSVSLGGGRSAAIKEDGSLWMWGSNAYGALGDGSTNNSYVPIKIMEDVKSVSLGGGHSAAIKEDGSLWMWGLNGSGQLGDGTTSDSYIPKKIMEDVKTISLGTSNSGAIKEDGSLWTWGYNVHGELGNQNTWNSYNPIKIMEDVKTVSLGSMHSAVIKEDGNLWMWGYNSNGQLGNGSTESSLVPVKILEDVKEISLGGYNSAAIKKDGSLWAWGQNTKGSLGVGIYGNSYVPKKVMENATKVSYGTFHSAAIKEDGSLWMWGSNQYGRLGNGNSSPTYSAVPIQIMPAGSIDVSSIGGGGTEGSGGGTGGSSGGSGGGTVTFPVDVESLSAPQIKVIDSGGKPIAGASVRYNNTQTQTTTTAGTATLEGYKKGMTLTISKDGYHTLTIPSYTRSDTGCTTHILYKESERSNEVNSVTLTIDGMEADVLTTEAVINRHYTIKELSLTCKGSADIVSYALYSGSNLISGSYDGTFKNLKYTDFKVREPVYLQPNTASGLGEKMKLGIQVIDQSVTIPEFAIGDSMKLTIPESVPLLGGKEFELALGDSLPIEFSMDPSGEIKFGINVTELAKDIDDWFATLKKLDKNNAHKYFEQVKKTKPKSGLAGIKPDFDVIGYMEGNILNPDHFTGRLFVEISIEKEWENQYVVYAVPVVVEIGISGAFNADGSLTFTANEGYSGSLGVGGEIGAELYGGIGLANIISGGIYGEAALGAHYIIFPQASRGLDQLYVRGAAGIEGRFLGNELAKLELVNGTYYIIEQGKSNSRMAHSADGNTVFAIDNDKVYQLLDRSYLPANGGVETQWMSDAQVSADGSVQETELQGAAYPDIIPTVVRVGDTVMLFYLTDAGAERVDADRSMLVYSVWDDKEENWSEPKAVLDDGTADFTPDIYSDGSKVYAVWQNAGESLAGGLTLNEIADRLTLHAAVYDPEGEETGFTDMGAIESGNGLFQQQPQIVSDRDTVSVYWYENEQDNVLGLSGTNRIYRAVLSDVNAVSVVSVLSVPTEEDEEYTEDLDTVTEEKDSDLEIGEEPASEDYEAEEAEAHIYTGTFTQYVAEGEEDETMTEAEEVDPEEDKTVSEEEEAIPEESEEESGEAEPEEGEGENDETESGEEADPDDGLTDDGEAEPEDDAQTEIYNAPVEAVQVMADVTGSAWKVDLLYEEKNCIVSADAGMKDGKVSYAYVAGKLDGMLELTDGSVIMLSGETETKALEKGICGHVEFTQLYGKETLTWYKDGDIRYVNGDGSIRSLFGESRLFNAVYTLLSDGNSVEILFPLNMGGKSNLYRIASEGGVFGTALPVTDQEDYIQYVDGFIDGDRTIMVYNRMEAEVLESDDGIEINEKNNSLCTGILAHSYYDIAIQSAGSMVRKDEETGEDVLEITAQVYNNGTTKAEQMNLSLAKADGTVLETVPVDTVLESGESDYVTAVFSPDNITAEGEYTVTVFGNEESNTANNSVTITLGEASLQIAAEVIAVGDTRTMQIGIENTGVTACGGTVSVRDIETGEVYFNSDFEPIVRGQTAFTEIAVDKSVFAQKDVLVLEAVVIPTEADQAAISDFVTVYAPTYTVDFVTESDNNTAFVSYGKTVDFPKNPTKEGAYFAGWYTTKNSTSGMLYTEETPITEDVTLYACFVQEHGSISLQNCSVSVIPAQIYTGKEIKPAVTVKWGSEVLSSKTDYTVSYQDNKEQGKATVTITGKGGYSGTVTRNFMILYPLNKVTVKAIPAVDFTGEYHMPDVTVTYQNETLTKGEDYTVTYTNNRNAGTAGVTLTGMGAYSGTKTVTFDIHGLSITKGIVFEKPEDVVYSGGKQMPVITVKTEDGTQLQAGSDYKVVYENAVNKGTATATVIGNGNFTGTKKFTYKILAKPLTADMIADIAPQTYTGSTIKPEITVADKSTSAEPLIQGTDYTVSYVKNKATGTATVTVKGKGNYSGTVKTSFEIKKVDLKALKDNGQLTVKVSDMAYTGKALKPSVQVYEGTKKLAGSAYTLTYANNVGTNDGKSVGTVSVTGEGNYIGTVTADFRIVDRAKLITSLKIGKIANQTYTGSAVEPAVTVMDGDYQLVRGKDYEASYSNQYNAGKATVTIRGIGTYAGSKNVIYKIAKRAIANGNVLNAGFTIASVPNMKYTGYALKPDVVMKDSNKVLELGKDYKLSYKNNTKISTGAKNATVTVKGMGNYSGSINSTTFNIVSWDYDSLQAEIPDQVYTGKALKPQVIFTIGGEEIALKSGTAVKITYTDNKNAGTAIAAITGKGELGNMGPIKVTFTIEPASLENAVVGKVKNQTLKGFAVTPIPKVKVGKTTLKANRDFAVKYLRNGVKGEAEMVITGIGNYAGECRKTFIVQ